MEALEDLTWRLTFLLGTHSDRCAVRIGAGDHQHVIAGQAVVAGADVTREMGASDVAGVDFGAGVGPGDSDENVFGHRCSSLERGTYSNTEYDKRKPPARLAVCCREAGRVRRPIAGREPPPLSATAGCTSS